MTERILDATQTLGNLPEVWPEPLLDTIRANRQQNQQKLVVLDDDPTGSQTVHGVPLLSEWSVAALADELRNSDCFYVLTNSRSLPGGCNGQGAVGIAIDQNSSVTGNRVLILKTEARRPPQCRRGNHLHQAMRARL